VKIKPQDEKIECMVCLTEAVNKTKMSRCCHFFCFECIVKWTEVTNCCPLCKVPSFSLHRFGNKQYRRANGTTFIK